ncbi:MAG: hypothetical protein ABJE95_10475 [Byssovorax sp.]
MGSDTPATAEGDLARTPFAHLLVYAVDRRLTGALFLREPPIAGASPIEHVVRLARGTPVKVRPGDGFARLGELLVEAGALSPETLVEALATKGLLGDVLLLAGCVERDRLEAVCESQFQRRMTRLFTLPAETTFRYCDGHVELLDYGGDPASVDALAIVWTGIKAHGGTRPIVDATLSRLGEMPLRIHPQATVTRLGLVDDEARVVAHLHACPEPFAALAARDLLAGERLRQLVYALAITRQLDVGSSSPPVGALEVTRTPSTPMAATSVARLQLKPTTHRIGAAAPDAAGDGERGATSSKPVTGPRSRMTPLSTPRLRDDPPSPRGTADPTPTTLHDEPTTTAIPGKSRGEMRETLKSARGIPVPAQLRTPSVEVIDLDAPPITVRAVPPIDDAEPSAAAVDGPPSALRGLSATALAEIAGTRLAARDYDGALEACLWSREVEPGNVEIAALDAWIRGQRAGADLKGLTIELDELLSASPDHRNARYYRALLRKRLGDNAGAIRDLRLLQKRTPPDAEAITALEALEEPTQKPRTGLLGWLFKR